MQSANEQAGEGEKGGRESKGDLRIKKGMEIREGAVRGSGQLDLGKTTELQRIDTVRNRCCFIVKLKNRIVNSANLSFTYLSSWKSS